MERPPRVVAGRVALLDGGAVGREVFERRHQRREDLVPRDGDVLEGAQGVGEHAELVGGGVMEGEVELDQVRLVLLDGRELDLDAGEGRPLERRAEHGEVALRVAKHHRGREEDQEALAGARLGGRERDHHAGQQLGPDLEQPRPLDLGQLLVLGLGQLPGIQPQRLQHLHPHRPSLFVSHVVLLK